MIKSPIKKTFDSPLLKNKSNEKKLKKKTSIPRKNFL